MTVGHAAPAQVPDRINGRVQIYRLCAEPLREVYDWVERYERFWRGKVASLAKYLDQADSRTESPRR